MSLLDTDVQIFVVTLVLIFGFFLGHAMDGVLGDEGRRGWQHDLDHCRVRGWHLCHASFGEYREGSALHLAGGLAGAFSLLATLVLGKYVLHRNGY